MDNKGINYELIALTISIYLTNITIVFTRTENVLAYLISTFAIIFFSAVSIITTVLLCLKIYYFCKEFELKWNTINDELKQILKVGV
jgi:hypothetical protein